VCGSRGRLAAARAKRSCQSRQSEHRPRARFRAPDFFMLPLQFSSGDLVADRHPSLAQMLFETGDHLPAAELMRDALALAPAWAAGWFRLGEMLAEAGELAAAADAWGEAAARRASAAAAESTCLSPDRVPLDTSRSGHTL